MKHVRNLVGAAEIVVVVGLLLIGVGLWEVSRAAALAASGAVLVWMALPSRPPFIQK